MLTAKFSDDLLRSFIQKKAAGLGLEGTAQLVDPEAKKVSIAICGKPDDLDEFIDLMHKGAKNFELLDIEIEPFLKEKDYRAVFRIIE